MKELLQNIRQHLLSGVSFAIPFIACGGILIALTIAMVPMTATGPYFDSSPNIKLINQIGVASFTLMLPVLAGYISHSIAGKPGLVPGFIGGYLCGTVNAGFLGALLIGLIAGYLANGMKKLPVSRYIRPIMPILIIPIVTSTIAGILVLKVIGLPIASLMQSLTLWLHAMGTGNRLVLALILGGMIAFDMGGPINKTAFFFGAAMIKEGNFGIMGCIAAAICTPPLGMGLATVIRRSLWTEEQRESGLASLAMGMIGITEGAIPFGAADPLRMIPCLMLGSMSAAAVAMWGDVGDHAPHGGPIVIFAVDHKLHFAFAILIGSLVTALAAVIVKTIQPEKQK